MKAGFATLIGTLMCFTVFLSCEEEYLVPGEPGLSYFPLEVGRYVIYEVDSTNYDDFNMVVRRRILQVRESVESVFTDASGMDSYRIVREYRDSSHHAWGTVGYDIWFAAIEGVHAERIEENQRYIKLSFPLYAGKTWEGNTHINIDPFGPLGYLEGWEYTLSDMDAQRTIGSFTFDSTLSVVQHASGSAIDTVGAREVYARGIGLVYKELYVLESQCTSCEPNDVPCILACRALSWEEKAEKGFIFKQKILEYGML